MIDFEEELNKSINSFNETYPGIGTSFNLML